jgi:dipeptidyl-peptidase 4
MSRLAPSAILLCAISVPALAPSGSAAETSASERQAMYQRYLEFASYVKGGSVTPHWMADGSSFWYAEGAPDKTVIYKVDPKANTRTPLFDTARLRRALTPVLGHEQPYQGLPFAQFTFLGREKAVQFSLENREFILQLESYTITQAPAVSEEEKSRRVPRVIAIGTYDQATVMTEELSPDGRWFAGIKEYNLYVRSPHDGRSLPLTTDGVKDHEWDAGRLEVSGPQIRWSPDSSRLAVKKVDARKVPRIPIVHYLKRPEEVEWVPYPKAGEPQPERELFIVDVSSKRQVRVVTGEERDQTIEILGWRPDGSELLFFRVLLGGKRPQVMAANPETGATRVVVTEPIEMYAWRKLFILLEDGKRFLWGSKRDGWSRLYLYNLDGKLLEGLTGGERPVGQVVAVDEQGGWVYFMAQGDRQRPRDSHFYRVNLEGKGVKRLTEATGQHRIEFAPSRQFFLDTHSALDRPSVVELRRSDGTLLRKLAEANIEALKELKWSPPEEFTLKSADGKTDRYGVLYRPYDFTSNRKYPVIQLMTGAGVSFAGSGFPRALAQLGFVVFVIYRDDYGISPELVRDDVAALQQLAAKRPYMDLTRVGVAGGSYFGWLVLQAMLRAPDVYHVGVATAPVTDQAEHSGRALMLGPPASHQQAYEDASNLRLAGNLKGKLLLMHGTSDTLVPISHTMKMVEALIQADKHFDLIIVPEVGHGGSARVNRYVWYEAIPRYFQEHLNP